MTSSPVERNVEAMLLSTKRFRRKPGDVPYPVEYSNGMSNLDIWDNMFFTTCCRSLTMHQFEKPPGVVLDLGCGSGFWAIEAAKHWTTSTIVGYDVNNIQPKLHVLKALYGQHCDLADRIKWVHGNLLDGLPFPSRHFDFVRVVGIGLGVPEDEWQYVFEDIARVMKSGGVLEIIEEDPIFPCERPPSPPPCGRPRLPHIMVNFVESGSAPSSAYSNKSSTTLLLDSWNGTPDDRSDTTHSTSTHSFKFTPPPNLSPELPHTTIAPLYQHTHSQPSISESHRAPDLRDHSRLKSAWEAMLSRRFLATNLLAVLPFYLSSTFVDVQTRPSIKIPLPSNSGLERSTNHRSSEESMISGWANPDVCCDSTSHPPAKSVVYSDGLTCPSGSTSWTSLHLAKTVKTVTGCKEAMWEEYQTLYSADLMPPVTRTTRPEDVIAQSSRASSREAFEADWSSWQNDMADRMSLRGAILAQFAWNEPPGDRPDWRVWRSALDKARTSSESFSSRSSISPERRRPLDFCRSMRGFVGWKP